MLKTCLSLRPDYTPSTCQVTSKTRNTLSWHDANYFMWCGASRCAKELGLPDFHWVVLHHVATEKNDRSFFLHSQCRRTNVQAYVHMYVCMYIRMFNFIRIKKLLWRFRVPIPLSINAYGGTEIPVFRRCVDGMIERAVQLISIIKK